MSTRSKKVTAASLKKWPLPAVGDSKYGRGEVLVVGGAARSPGAAMLAGVAALRVGAGKLGLAVGESVAVAVAVAVPESGVAALPENATGGVDGRALAAASDDLDSADAVLLGPGLDEPEEAQRLLRDLPQLVSRDAIVVLDAFVLGSVPQEPEAVAKLAGRVIFTPNKPEAALLLDIDESELDLRRDIPRIAERFDAVVTCYDVIADASGTTFTVTNGGAGLGTSGSGDALAGAIAGFAARGATPLQAAVYGTWAHATAGDLLTERVGALGYLARELADELPRALALVAK